MTTDHTERVAGELSRMAADLDSETLRDALALIRELQALRRAGSGDGQVEVTGLREALAEIAAAWRKEAVCDTGAKEPLDIAKEAAISETYGLCAETLEAALDAAAPPAPMTLERAVAVLNERRHNQCDDWVIRAAGHLVESERSMDALTPFEAQAIAAAYERDATGEAQEVRDGDK